jgi:ABC-type histidine transport system ATPase subunit
MAAIARILAMEPKMMVYRISVSMAFFSGAPQLKDEIE